jgi:hypothetical protein
MMRLAIKDKHKDMIIARNYNFKERRILAQLVMLIAPMLCIGFFLNSQLGKREFANLYYKGFSIIFRIKSSNFKHQT